MRWHREVALHQDSLGTTDFIVGVSRRYICVYIFYMNVCAYMYLFLVRQYYFFYILLLVVLHLIFRYICLFHVPQKTIVSASDRPLMNINLLPLTRLLQRIIIFYRQY